MQGQIQDFKLGGGGALKKNCAEQREARNFLGYFMWKITILRQKNIFFPILGGRAPGAPLDPPLYMIDSDRRPFLKSASTDVIIPNHGPILGYSQIGVLSKLSYLLVRLHDISLP
jgi:hypothetical protein